MEQPHRAQSAMQMRPGRFQARATQMLKNIRNRFTGKTKKFDDVDGPYKPGTRSMDVRMSHPTLGLGMDSGPTDGQSSRTTSSMSTSPVPLNSSPISTWDTLGQGPIQIVKSESMPAKPRPLNNAAGFVTADQVLTHVQTGMGAPDIVVSVSRIPTDEMPHSDQVTLDDTLSPAVSKAPKRLSGTTTNALRAVHTSSADPASLPFDTTTKPPLIPQTSSPPASVSSRRAVAPLITDMPPPPSAFRVSASGSVRLSPSIITRQVQMPFLNLPKMPEPSSAPSPPSPKPQTRLRSMPALTVDGVNELDQEVDHDNAGLGDTDEDDEGEDMNGGSDEDGEDLAQANSSLSSDRSYIRQPTHSTQGSGLPVIDMTTLDLSFPPFKSPVAGSSAVAAPLRQEEESTPTPWSSFDYFSAKPLPGPSGTPRVSDRSLKPSSKTRPATSAGTPVPRLLPMPPSPGPSRPRLHHHVSKSMVDILSPMQEPAKDLDGTQSPCKGKGKAPDRPEVSPACPEYSEGPGLRRRRSMPIFNATSDPPPYPTFSREDRFFVVPRDDEGKERLPGYSNAIHLTAVMPRKMEFSSPGVQAKDRKWRRTLCELQGTVFRIYKCPPGVTGTSAIGEWWEKRVGVGDIAASGSTAKGVPTNEAVGAGERQPKLAPDSQEISDVQIPSGSWRTQDVHPPQSQTAAPTQIARLITTNLLHPVTRGGSSPAQSRPQIRSENDASTPSGDARSRLSLGMSATIGITRSSSHLDLSNVSSFNQSTTGGVPSASGSSSTSPSRPFFTRSGGRSSSGSFTRPSPDVLRPDSSDLIRTYSMQHAESGLGNDYLKRKNVIRVRMEGEQFLLQAHDITDVVEWIEALQASTNIALDLDERVMPKGPMFPRRRRRRRRPEPNGTTPADRSAQS